MSSEIKILPSIEGVELVEQLAVLTFYHARFPVPRLTSFWKWGGVLQAFTARKHSSEFSFLDILDNDGLSHKRGQDHKQEIEKTKSKTN